MSKFHPDEVPGEALEGVSLQLGGWLDKGTAEKFYAAAAGASPPNDFINFDVADIKGGGALLGQQRPPSFELKETFAIWSLNLDHIEEGLRTGADLLELAQDTGRWHHQITCNGQPTGFARSTSEQATGLDVCQLYVSDLANHIDKAIKWLDDFEEKNPDYQASNPLVRMLFVPSYQTHAFWVIREPRESFLVSLMLRVLRGMGINIPARRATSDVLIIDAPSYLKPLRPLMMLNSQQLLEAFREKEPLGGGLTFGPPK